MPLSVARIILLSKFANAGENRESLAKAASRVQKIGRQIVGLMSGEIFAAF